MIATYFNGEELIELCTLLEIDHETLGGEGKKAQAGRLVSFIERRGRTEELLGALDQLRPKVAWPAI